MHQLYVHCLRKRSILSLVLLLLSFLSVVSTANAARRTVPAIVQVQGPNSGNYKKGDKLRFAVTFNTPVKITGVAKIPITLTSGTRYAQNEIDLVGGTVQYFSYVIAPGDDMSGTVSWGNYIDLSSGLIKDLNSTDALDVGKYYFPAATPLQVSNVVIDGTPPTASTFTTNGAINVPNTNAALTFNVVFSEPVMNVTNAGWIASGSNKVTTGGFTIAMNADKKTGLATFTNVVNTDPSAVSTFGLVLKAALCGITDLAGNPLGFDVPSNSYYLDKAPEIGPMPTITVVGGKTNVNGPFSINITFDKSVTGAFDPTKLLASNASATFTGTAVGGPYTYTITPNASPVAGTITLQLQANAVSGQTGTPSSASAPVTVNYDLQRPTVTITPNVDFIAKLFKPVITFSKPVTGLTLSGLTGTNGTPTLTEISPFDHTTYQVSFSPVADETDITFGVIDNAATDNFGNGNIANSITYHYDVKPPVVSKIVALITGPTNGTTGSFQVTFSENVQPPAATDFAAVMSAGLTGATVTAVTQISPTTYQVDFGNIAGDGNLQLQIPVGNNIKDLSGNLLVGPIVSSAYITYDHTAPILTLPTATTFNAPFTFVYTFNEPVVIGNTSSVTWTNATVSAITQVDATHYQQTVTPTAIGNFSVNVLADAFHDIAGNPLAQAYSFTATYNNTIPTVTLSGPGSYNSPFTINVHLSAALTPTLDVSFFSITNGTISNIAPTSAVDYTFVVTPNMAGPITVFMKAGMATNGFGVSNAQSNMLTWTYDPLPFNINLTAPVNAINTFDVTVNLTKPVSQLTTSNLSITNGTVTNIIKVSDQEYTVTVGITSTGAVTVTVPANQFTDAVGRPNAQGGPITVNGVLNHAPTDIALDNSTIAENKAIGTLIGNFSTTDVDPGNTFTYTLSGADAASFAVNGSQLISNVVFDYEVKSSYQVTVTATDNYGASFTKTFTITVLDANEPPTDITLSNSSIDEFKPQGTLVGTLSTTDPDAGDTFTYTFAGGADDASFSIVGNQLKSNAVFNYALKNTYQIKIKVTDVGGLSFMKDFVITVIATVPTSISLDNTTVINGSPVGTLVGNLSATSPIPGDNLTYGFAGGPDDASFTIVGNQLKVNTVVDYATKNTYNIAIYVSGSGGTFSKPFVIKVINHAPTDINLDNTAVPEGSAVGTTVGNLTATDVDAGDTFTYTFAGGTDDGAFTISNNQLKTAAVFNYATKNTYNIKIKVTDAGGLSYTKDFVITVTKVNHAPTDISLDNTAVPEGSAVGTTVGNLTATDVDAGDTFTYSFAGGTDDGAFTIVNNQLKTAAVFNYATKSTYNIKIKVTDAGGLSYTKDFVITVTKVNHAPTDISLDNNKVPEGSAIGTVVGNFTATDPDAGDTFTYSFAGGTDDAQFTISGNQLKTAAVFNYATKNTYSIKIKVTDAGGLSFTKDFTINVTSTNSAPTNITLDKNTILDKAAVGTLIGSFSATDPDAGETFTWAFAGGPDDAQFKLTGNQLFSNAAINYLQKSSYTVRIRVTDHGGLTFEKDFVINVLFINQPPTIDPVTNQVACDGHQAQEIKLTGLSAGPETNQNITIVATSSNDFFESLTTRDNKDGTGAIRYTLKQNISGTTTITVLVRDDGGTANGGVDQKIITFQLLVNELPDAKIVSDIANPVPAGSIVHLTASGGVSYQWGEAPGIVDGKNTATLTIKPEASSTYLVTVTNSNGCTVTTDFKLEVSGEVKVEATNLVTPNGDGINDRWMVKNISRYPNNEVRIFDRAGRLVYNRKGYANEWDGTLNGHRLAEGTYYYLLDLGNGQVVKGFITLILQQ
ncbi:MAG: cadherin domain-containing protein [Chitinophaga sp.]|uniref:cadherin domain-containing protein n=1 Tax=Chitinophaga sp. TaxID=1869181 RepID=UPI0025C3C9DF|nr:cadherin domain-containing protein [Chitinophaga sp.]MBV8255897.1 cadherin domain-containing protein [Chitinophaga sp.]